MKLRVVIEEVENGYLVRTGATETEQRYVCKDWQEVVDTVTPLGVERKLDLSGIPL